MTATTWARFQQSARPARNRREKFPWIFRQARLWPSEESIAQVADLSPRQGNTRRAIACKSFTVDTSFPCVTLASSTRRGASFPSSRRPLLLLLQVIPACLRRYLFSPLSHSNLLDGYRHQTNGWAAAFEMMGFLWYDAFIREPCKGYASRYSTEDGTAFQQCVNRNQHGANPFPQRISPSWDHGASSNWEGRHVWAGGWLGQPINGQATTPVSPVAPGVGMSSRGDPGPTPILILPLLGPPTTFVSLATSKFSNPPDLPFPPDLPHHAHMPPLGRHL